MESISEDERLAQRIRKLDPEKYTTLCRMHLSFHLDLTSEDLLAVCGNKEGRTGNRKQPFTASLHRKFRVVPSSNVTLTQVEVNNLNTLIQFLGHSHNICEEGLFRKSGKKSRQHALRHLISTGVPLQLEGSLYNAHDCASVLKGFLADLPEPLLTESHFIAHCQIADLYKDSSEHSQNEMVKRRQIEALQLLFLLLPNKNRNLLRNLLTLLHRVSQDNQRNRMNAVNLATMFSPHLLCPRKMTPEEFYQKSSMMTKAVALMIENAPELFKIPSPLIVDLKKFWDSKRNIGHQHKEGLEYPVLSQDGILDSSAVQTAVSFCDRQKSDTDHNYTTAAALAELYSHIRSMPDSGKKKQLMKQIHKDNSIQSPLHPQNSVNHVRSRSLRKSIRHHIFGSHKRHRTSQFYMPENVANECDSSSVILKKCSNSKSECEHNRSRVNNQGENSALHNANIELETIRHPAYCPNQKSRKLRLPAAMSSVSPHKQDCCARGLECLSKSIRCLSLVSGKCNAGSKSLPSTGYSLPSKCRTTVNLVAFTELTSSPKFSLVNNARRKEMKTSMSMAIIRYAHRHSDIFRETAL